MSRTYRRIKEGGKVRNALHKYDGRKMASVVNHVFYERRNGFESTRHRLRHSTGLHGTEAA